MRAAIEVALFDRETLSISGLLSPLSLECRFFWHPFFVLCRGDVIAYRVAHQFFSKPALGLAVELKRGPSENNWCTYTVLVLK